jgi:hypothetical protein
MRKTRDRLENRNTRFHKPDGEKEKVKTFHYKKLGNIIKRGIEIQQQTTTVRRSLAV